MKYSIRKSILLMAFSVSLAGLVASCDGNKNRDNDTNENATAENSGETKDEAEDMNDAKFDNKDGEKNASFVVDAVSSSLAEIRLAELASNRATSANVKELAETLKKDHTALLGDLKKYAEAKVISVPTEADDDKADNLADEKDNFDRKWCERVRDMHENSIKRFEDASNDLTDAELKNLATTALPKLRTHYDKIVASLEKLPNKNNDNK
jgi:putative membrane protein